MHLAPPPSVTDPITESLRLILLGVRTALGLWRLDAPVGIALYTRCGKIFFQIKRMLTRYRAGTLRHGTPRGGVTPRAQARQTRALVLPRRFGWLLPMGKHHAVSYGLQLRHLLQEPEMAAMLAEYPQARRVLRPLLRALAVELPWTVTPPRPPRPPKPRKPRPKPEPYKIPLPRGVITWARREKALEKARNRIREHLSLLFR